MKYFYINKKGEFVIYKSKAKMEKLPFLEGQIVIAFSTFFVSGNIIEETDKILRLKNWMCFNKSDRPRKTIAYCECCGIPIHEGDVYCKLDGVYYCDYCGGENSMAISEMEEEE